MNDRIIEKINHTNLKTMKIHVKPTGWASVFKTSFCYIRIIILVAFVSFATSFIYLNYSLDSCCKSSFCYNLSYRLWFMNGRGSLNLKTARTYRPCHCHHTVNVPLDEKLALHKRDAYAARTGAQLCANQSALKEPNPRLIWSHVSSDSFLDGINHVTHHHGNHEFDCLEVTRDDRYLVSIQLTYRYTATEPPEAVRSYFTLAKFGHDNVVLVSKSDFSVPEPINRNDVTVRQPIIMLRSVRLNSGDRLCVTVAHPELIYASQIDNFFGMYSL